MKKMYLYPVWLRIWHWINAFLFLFLIATGISMYYADESDFLISFDNARLMHNITGITASVCFILYVIFNIKSKNYKHYIPKLQGITERMIKQGRFYVYGIFKGEDHPYHISEKEKFNPLQQITYFSVMFVMFPIVIISGWFLFFPELAPAEILGMGGVWPMVVLHIVFGFILSVFMFGHIYLATHGETMLSNFKSMFTGYHEVHGEHDANVADEDNKKEEIEREDEAEYGSYI